MAAESSRPASSYAAKAQPCLAQRFAKDESPSIREPSTYTLAGARSLVGRCTQLNVSFVGACSTQLTGDAARPLVYNARSAGAIVPSGGIALLARVYSQAGTILRRCSSVAGQVQIRCSKLPVKTGLVSSSVQKPSSTHNWQFLELASPALCNRHWVHCLAAMAERKAPCC